MVSTRRLFGGRATGFTPRNKHSTTIHNRQSDQYVRVLLLPQHSQRARRQSFFFIRPGTQHWCRERHPLGDPPAAIANSLPRRSGPRHQSDRPPPAPGSNIFGKQIIIASINNVARSSPTGPGLPLPAGLWSPNGLYATLRTKASVPLLYCIFEKQVLLMR